jgi:hypothetical protein
MQIRNLVCFIFLIYLSPQLIGQGNLQFSQVITLVNGQSYTVPSGAVFKVESMNQFSSGTISLDYNGSCMINCPSCGASSGVTCYYNGITYLQLGGVILNKGGDNTYINSGGSCTVCPPTKTVSISLPTVDFPIWLKAGEQVSLKVAGAHISGIEFVIN